MTPSEPGARSQTPFRRINPLFGHPPCLSGSTCRYQLDEFRTKLVGRYVAVDVPFADQIISAILDLRGLDAETHRRHVRRLSKGAVNRDAAKADRRGYSYRRFDFNNHLQDVADINHSKEVRSGGPMRSPYRRSASELAEEPGSAVQPCPLHYDHWWGAFDQNGLMGGYIRVRRNGDYALLGQILGHGRHLRHGVMHGLTLAVVDRLCGSTPDVAGLDSLVYAAWHSGGDGLQSWKRRHGFEPALLVCDAHDAGHRSAREQTT